MAYATGKQNRGTIFVEDAAILAREEFAGHQHVLRLAAPETAARDLLGPSIDAVVANEWGSVVQDRSRHPGTVLSRTDAPAPFSNVQELGHLLHRIILGGSHDSLS